MTATRRLAAILAADVVGSSRPTGRLPFRWVDENDHLGTMIPFGALSTPSP
jgi:hypothetical protein